LWGFTRDRYPSRVSRYGHMTTWALSLRRSEASVLSKLYGVPDVHVGEAGDVVWVRGTSTDSEVETLLERVPTSRLYEIVDDDRLKPKGRLLPTARLPRLSWVPLRDWLIVRVPTAALPGELQSHAALQLVPDPMARRSGAGEELLVCRVEAFREFLLWSPAHRLAPLGFAVDEARGEALVRGKPLPSIPGERFVVEGGVAVPAGQGWTPAVSPGVVRTWLGTREGTLALWRADGTIGEIDEDAFVSASRRAGRVL